MCCLRVRLMWSSIAASVVVFPEPVSPVTRTRPRCSSARRLHARRQLSESNVGICRGMTRKANEIGAALAEAVDAEARQLRRSRTRCRARPRSRNDSKRCGTGSRDAAQDVLEVAVGRAASSRRAARARRRAERPAAGRSSGGCRSRRARPRAQGGCRCPRHFSCRHRRRVSLGGLRRACRGGRAP